MRKQQIESDNEAQRLNDIFDRQAQFENQWNKKSRVHQELFNLTRNFTIMDWKQIRNESYWSFMATSTDDGEKKRYTLSCVKRYLKIA
jgi:hypothetical protein